MRREIVLIFVFGMLILSSGCVPRKMERAEVKPTGFEGVSVELLKNMPPENVWKGSVFSIGLKLENKGLHDVENGIIRIGGFTKYLIEPSYVERRFMLKGRDPYLPSGELKIEEFQFRNIRFEGFEKEDFVETFYIEVVYDYGTSATVDVCINPKIGEPINVGCSMLPVVLRQGQGAPVAVTRITPSVVLSDGKVIAQLLIEFENKGDGDVNYVEVDGVYLGKEKMECDKPALDLSDGSDTLRCKLALENKEPFVTPVKIEVSYLYSIDLSGKITFVS